MTSETNGFNGVPNCNNMLEQGGSILGVSRLDDEYILEPFCTFSLLHGWLGLGSHVCRYDAYVGILVACSFVMGLAL